jgi:hypothetical protein
MTDATLNRALAYARCGWPVLPCRPGQKIPATRHGYRDATTDQQQITDWFGRGSGWNLAIATGTPGPDVLDVDQHGPAGNGYPAFTRLRRAGLVDGAAAYVRTPAGGMHAYFTGSGQHNGRLPSHHLDFRSHGGYILARPPRSTASPTPSSPDQAATAAWTGTRSPDYSNPAASSTSNRARLPASA